MATFLDLPREIYLIICSLLSTKELVSLSALSRDHYLAVQRPLYSKFGLTSYPALVKLVGALTKPPVISPLSPSQIAYRRKNGNIQFDERQVENLDLTLNVQNEGEKITAATLAQCIKAIGRNCHAAKIAMTLEEASPKFVKVLKSTEFPGVAELTVFLRLPSPQMPEGNNPYAAMHPDRLSELRDFLEFKATGIWAIFFTSMSFPDLRRVRIISMVTSASTFPCKLAASLELGTQRRRLGHRPPANILRNKDGFIPQALINMEEISLEYNDILYGPILDSLFASNIVPERLTKLRIVQCPPLHPIIEMKTIAKLLHRSLPLLQFLTLHLTPHNDGHYGYKIAYQSKISETPEHHVCNIVRELGQNIKGLDLLLPFACHHMFAPSAFTGFKDGGAIELKAPDIAPMPARTLPDRVIAAGYRYRRIIFNDFCCDSDDWGEMTSRASDQGENVSWELLYDLTLSTRSKGVWLVSDCLPVELSVQEVMERPFSE